jgi:putative membrane protein
MKNNKHFRTNFLLVVFGTATLIGASSFSNFRQLNKSVAATIVKTDAQFLASAAEINLEEIQLGQLAQTKSTVMDVKELGKMMETEHQKSLNDLTTLADKKGITLPKSVTSEAKEEYKELNNKSEKRFNDEYCELMIKGHKHAISLFESASKDSVDPEIKAWANSTLPALRAHLDHAKMCKAKCEKM